MTSVKELPKKYEHIDFSLPKGVNETAKQAVEWIKQGHAGDGFTDVGRKRASDLARADYKPSPEIVRRMYSYLSRHQSDKSGKGFKYGEKGFPSAGRVAYDAWGGDAAYTWSEKVVNQMDKADENMKTISSSSGGTGFAIPPDYVTSKTYGHYDFLLDMLEKISNPQEKEYIQELIKEAELVKEQWFRAYDEQQRIERTFVKSWIKLWDTFLHNEKASWDVLTGFQDGDFERELAIFISELREYRDNGIRLIKEYGGDPSFAKTMFDKAISELASLTSPDNFEDVYFSYTFLDYDPQYQDNYWNQNDDITYEIGMEFFGHPSAVIDAKKVKDELDDKFYKLDREITNRIHNAKTGTSKSNTYVGSYLEDQQMQETVPNYREAMPTSPRKCETCRFFRSNGETGSCTVFGVEVEHDYVCDAWQALELTPTHTKVRSLTQSTDIDGNVQYQSDMIPSYQTRWQSGNVQGMQNQTLRNDEARIFVERTVDYQDFDEENDYIYPDEAPIALRGIRKAFIVNDYVYSSSLRSMGVIQTVGDVNGQKVYGIKLINQLGVVTGYGVTTATDLTPKSNKALKGRIKSEIEIETDQDVLKAALEDTIAITRKVYRALETVYYSHANENVPLSMEKTLTPLQSDLLSVLDDPVLRNVKTGKRRKYVRAIQEAASSIGSARQVLFDAENQVRSTRTGKLDQNQKVAYAKAQNAALERVRKAYEVIKAALTLPSATHGDAPVGI